MKHIVVVQNDMKTEQELAARLAPDYDLSFAGSVAQALGLARDPDLILLDVERNGFEAIAEIKAAPRFKQTPVVFLGDDPEIEAQALEAGALDFITKTGRAEILLRRIDLHLKFSAYQRHLEETIQELGDNIVLSFTKLMERKETMPDGHLPATADYVGLIGRELLARGTFGASLNAEDVDCMIQAAPFHDIGKIGVRDSILMKAGPLSPEEFGAVKKHTVIGGQVLALIYERNPARRCFAYAHRIALGHHERFDGSGYPYGLAADAIPLCARIAAAANVYAACSADRPYRPALSREEAFGVIAAGKGTQFDPRIVEVFEGAKELFLRLPPSQERAGLADFLAGR
ncbi:MAG: HD domain-containing protein [Spirochaetaceae bacterium]|nr:HD domain-containing protein [Spirochaetaceae bacterium]